MRCLLLFLVPCCLLALAPAGPVPEVAPPAATSATPAANVADNGTALPDAQGMEELARQDPIAFQEACLRRYQREVKGYTAILQKQERIDGKLQPREVIKVAFREHPFSVYMQWVEGARLAERVLYVAGENEDKMLVRPAGVLARLAAGDVVTRDVDGPEARGSSRVTMNHFGIKDGMLRLLDSWKAASKDNALHVEYLGVKDIKETGDRSCWILQRTNYRQPEDNGVTFAKVFVDRQTWLQIGTILRGANNQLVGEYFFRDVQLNPEFKPGQFQPAALTP